MDLRFEYLEEEPHGHLSASSDFSHPAWNRILALVIGAQGDAKIVGNDIHLEWSTILTIVGDVADSRKELGFTTSYNDAAIRHLQHHREEVLARRTAVDHLQLDVSDIQVRLRLLGFTRRELTLAQLRDTAKIISLPNGANFSVPGAGKTTVALATHLLSRNADTRLLIIAPKNAFGAWDEVIEDCMDPAIVDEWGITRLIGGYDNIRTVLQNSPMRVMIGYNQLTLVRNLIARFLRDYRTHMIADESHSIKAGDRSRRGDALLRLAHLPVRRDILSGTPIPHDIKDIGPQLDFLWPGQRLGWRAVDAMHPNEALRDLYVRTTKQELGLPSTKECFIPVKMSAAADGTVQHYPQGNTQTPVRHPRYRQCGSTISEAFYHAVASGLVQPYPCCSEVNPRQSELLPL